MINNDININLAITSSYLHPEEESLGTGLELEHVDAPRRALVHPLELAVVRKDDQILEQQQRHAVTTPVGACIFGCVHILTYWE